MYNFTKNHHNWTDRIFSFLKPTSKINDFKSKIVILLKTLMYLHFFAKNSAQNGVQSYSFEWGTKKSFKPKECWAIGPQNTPRLKIEHWSPTWSIKAYENVDLQYLIKVFQPISVLIHNPKGMVWLLGGPKYPNFAS